mmetsp:Transcript_69212/g.164928  ORF Transcript_69212/g.164928 Transcript_69212/m.164928 type:complete len:209 (+) Transcript_69212:1206-1832(+)
MVSFWDFAPFLGGESSRAARPRRCEPVSGEPKNCVGILGPMSFVLPPNPGRFQSRSYRLPAWLSRTSCSSPLKADATSTARLTLRQLGPYPPSSPPAKDLSSSSSSLFGLSSISDPLIWPSFSIPSSILTTPRDEGWSPPSAATGELANVCVQSSSYSCWVLCARTCCSSCSKAAAVLYFARSFRHPADLADWPGESGEISETSSICI